MRKTFVVLVALLLCGAITVIACEPVCPPNHPNCGCTDEKYGQGCSTTPTDPCNPMIFGPCMKKPDAGAADKDAAVTGKDASSSSDAMR